MKRFAASLLAMMVVFSCAACSDVQRPSGEKLYGSETESIKSSISAELEEIDETEIAQKAYDLIDNAEALCKDGMEIISSAWHFGIWNAPECGTDTVLEQLSAQIGFDISFIEENGGYTAYELVNGDGNLDGWEFCLMTAENCLSAAGAYSFVNETLDDARDLIRKLPDDYVNCRYLKDYYTKVAAYAAYFENVSGSYNDLIEAIDRYESNIQTAKEPLLFDFG